MRAPSSFTITNALIKKITNALIKKIILYFELAKYCIAGRHRALLIGVNYVSVKKPAELSGCIRDVEMLEKFLLTHGWQRKDIRTITDTTRECLPTRRNILDGCRWLSQGAQPGDVLFFSFSGHGAQERDTRGVEEDGKNETILPLDAYEHGMISDDVLHSVMVRNLPSGCRLFSLVDACHSGTTLDLPFTWKSGKWKESVNPWHTAGDVQLLSGCKDSEKSADGLEGSALTSAFVAVAKYNTNLTYREMLDTVRKVIRAGNFVQQPMLTSSQAFSPDRLFSLNDAIANRNEKLGLIITKKFAPKKLRSPALRILLGSVLILLACACVAIPVSMLADLRVGIVATVPVLLLGVFVLFVRMTGQWAQYRLQLRKIRDAIDTCCHRRRVSQEHTERHIYE